VFHRGRPSARLPANLARVLVAIGLLAVAGCHNPGGPGPAPPDPVGAPALTCPADITMNVDLGPVPVTYDAPVVTGGSAPVATTCTLPSGSPFPGGINDVVCTATDAIQRSGQCVFHVTVNVVSRLQGTKFLAFGDSITAGETGFDAIRGFGPRVVDPLHSYPAVLEGLLRQRYVFQASDISVKNAGVSLETAVAEDAQQRFVDEVQAFGPDVVLLLEGANDVNGHELPENIATALSADVNRAYRFGARLVILSNLLPQIEGRGRVTNPEEVEPVNELIRDVAAREGAVLVDAFAAFDPQKDSLLTDGLHPSPEGYVLLANLFLDAIASNFQLPPPDGAALLFRRPGALNRRPGSPASTTQPGPGRAGHPAGRTPGRTWPPPR
jgi:lysophospholipase L1-like esterase